MVLERFLRRTGALHAACILVASLGAGCSSSDDGPSPGPTSVEMDVARYDLKGAYDWDRGRLVATVAITLTPETGAKAISLDSAVTEIKAVRLAGGGALPFSIDDAAAQLQVDVSGVPALASGADITLEIDYEAAPSGSLLAVTARKGDPLKDVRALFTMSEPLGAQRWMPCRNTPSDRALFSIEMEMAASEAMIANGEVADDEAGDGGSRRMKYATAYSLPTYLMAFAISDFEVESAPPGGVPVSIWHRRGLRGDYAPVLEEMVGMVQRFEELLGPYPFERYAVVQLPMLPAAGIENAGITFQIEGGGVEPISGELTLTAHELAHQWFGDLVTIESWDDLWIKEGMATLLEQEGTRDHTDKDGPLTLNGDGSWAADGEAIRDPSLEPGEKYTSGPYSRAAWLMTQIRSLVGEDAFWATLRGVLDTHRFGTIGTDEFLDAFAEALGPEATARARQAVDAKGIPALEIAPAASGGVTMTLRDPEGALVAPLDIAWVAADGSTQTETLELDKPLEVAPSKSGELLVLDPQDRHPTLEAFMVDEGSFEAMQTSLLPLLVPATPEQLARFLALGSAHQEPVLWSQQLDVPPGGFKAFLADLDSEWTRAVAVRMYCTAAGDPGLDPELAAAWKSVLAEELLVPPAPFALDLIQNGGYAECTQIDPVTAFADDWAKLETGLPSGGMTYMRLAFLSAFKLPAPLALSAWGSVAMQSNEAHMRWLATRQLRIFAGDLDPADAPAWRAFFVGLLSATEDTQVLGESIRGVVTTANPTAAENADALAGLSVVLHSPWTRPIHWRAVCAGIALTKGDAGAFQTFGSDLIDAPLSEDAIPYLLDPLRCEE